MIQAHFSQIGETISHYIENSKTDICLAVAWFTHQNLFNAVIKALERNVRVSIILVDDIINRGPNGLDFSTYIEKGGTIRFADTRKVLMHNKFCLFDGALLITGSYNWTYSAEMNNAENILITDDESTCCAFQKQFDQLCNNFPFLEKYQHLSFDDLEPSVFFFNFEDLRNEYKSMEQALTNISYTIKDLDNKKEDYSILKSNMVVLSSKKPKLKQKIGAECRIDDIDNRTLNIVNQGQVLPCIKSVNTQTAYDNQTSINCNIVYGNYDIADQNESLIKFKMNGLPPKKAGELKFNTTVRIDIDGYMYVKETCLNTGEFKCKICNIIDKIDYSK